MHIKYISENLCFLYIFNICKIHICKNMIFTYNKCIHNLYIYFTI